MRRIQQRSLARAVRVMTRRINDIDRQAAEWVAKTTGTEASAELQRALDAWLAQDPRHLGAYLKAKVVLAHVEKHADVLSGGNVVRLDRFRAQRRRIMAGTLAACFAAFAVVFGLDWWQSQPVTYVTKIGEHRTVTLSDGSLMTMNTGSKIAVRYSGATRSLTLEEGEVLFDVAKNKQRPFIVNAHGVTVQAVGTSFSVGAYESQTLLVTVREGVVQINAAAAPALVRAGSRATVLAAGRIVVEKLTPQQVEQDLAWRSGHIFFRHQSLAAAAGTFKRYSDTHIMIDDPAVASRTVTGMFVATDPASFAHAVAASLDLKTEEEKGEIRLTRK